jgi:PAS domain-containing protein
MKRLNSAVIFLFLSIPLLTGVSSQEPTGFHPLEPSDTSTPAATLNSLIRACNELDQLIEIGPVTEERADEILRESEARYRTLLESSPDPIVVYDVAESA